MNEQASHRDQVAGVLKRLSPLILCAQCVRHILGWENLTYIQNTAKSIAENEPGFEWEDGQCQVCQNRYGTWKVARYVPPISGESGL